jgi:hypothetical protein
MEAARPDSVRLELRVPPAASSGQPVPVQLRLRNSGAEPATVYLRGREIAFDIVVTRAGGDTIWHRLEGAAIPAIAQVRRLGPGEELVLEDRWSGRDRNGKPVPVGDYQVSGSLLTDREPMRAGPVALRVVSRGS